MIEDKSGFLRPECGDNCIGCSKCLSVCPANNIFEPQNRCITPIALAVKNRDETVRTASSSGGVFSAFAKSVINDGGIVVGAVFDNNFKKVSHKIATTTEQLYDMYGSKYLQSDFSNVYSIVKKHLEEGKKVLCCAAPCQIAALKLYLNCKCDNLFTVDFICHGVPSPKVWRDYLGDKDVKSVSFRDKSTGWKSFSSKICYSDGRKICENHLNNLFMKLFLSNLSLNSCCFECDYKGEKHCGDITIGDFWGIENICQEMDDNIGTSLVLVNTEKGKKLWENVKENLIFDSVDFEKAVDLNYSYKESVDKPDNYDAFFEDFQTYGIVKSAKKHLPKSPLKERLKKYKVIRKLVKIKHHLGI